MGFMFLFFGGRSFKPPKPLESTCKGLFQLSSVSDAREKPDTGALLVLCFSFVPFFWAQGLTQVAFWSEWPVSVLLNPFRSGSVMCGWGPQAEGGNLMPGPGSWQDWMHPAEDVSCHSPSRQDLCYGDATINHSALPSAHPANGQGVGEAWCKECQGPGSSSCESRGDLVV